MRPTYIQRTDGQISVNRRAAVVVYCAVKRSAASLVTAAAHNWWVDILTGTPLLAETPLLADSIMETLNLIQVCTAAARMSPALTSSSRLHGCVWERWLQVVPFAAGRSGCCTFRRELFSSRRNPIKARWRLWWMTSSRYWGLIKY